MTSDDTMRSGGRRLRQIREARQMTQMDIERATAARYDYEGRVPAQQVSRIEKGSLDKPPILDLLRYGEVLGLNPDDIAEMFGLWPRQSKESKLDPQVNEIVALARQLPPALHDELLTQLEVVIALTRAKLRARLDEREQEEQSEERRAGK